MNALLSIELLSKSPSYCSGISKEDEISYRLLGCELIAQGGNVLSLSQNVIATGQNILHRYYYCKSLTKYDVFTVAMGSLLISSKIEEILLPLRTFIVAYHAIYITRNKLMVKKKLEVGCKEYNAWKSELINIEMHILKELGFCFFNIIDHPYMYAIYLIKLFDFTDDCEHDLMQISWNYINDSMRLDLCVRYKPEVIATAAIYMAAKTANIVLPSNWWKLSADDMLVVYLIMNSVLDLYDREKVDWLPALCHVEYQMATSEEYKQSCDAAPTVVVAKPVTSAVNDSVITIRTLDSTNTTAIDTTTITDTADTATTTAAVINGGDTDHAIRGSLRNRQRSRSPDRNRDKHRCRDDSRDRDRRRDTDRGYRR